MDDLNFNNFFKKNNCPDCNEKPWLALFKKNENQCSKTCKTHKKCGICNKIIIISSYNFINISSCNCNFHFNCFEKKLINYPSIVFPKCPNCNQLFNKNKINGYPEILFDDAYKGWVSQFINCQEINCKKMGDPRKGNYCNEHAKWTIPSEVANNALTVILENYTGMPDHCKRNLFQEIISKQKIDFINT